MYTTVSRTVVFLPPCWDISHSGGRSPTSSKSRELLCRINIGTDRKSLHRVLSLSFFFHSTKQHLGAGGNQTNPSSSQPTSSSQPNSTMARTPSKKKPRGLRKGPRDPRQRVHSAASSPSHLQSRKGQRRGSHSLPSRRRPTTLPSIPELNSTKAMTSAGRGVVSGGIAHSRAVGSGVQDPEIMEIDDSDDDVAARPNSAADNANANLQNLLQYRGDESSGDFELQQALLNSAMTAQLSKNASARELSFTPEHLLRLVEDLIILRNPLLTLALQADGGVGTLHSQLESALPNKLTKRMKKKSSLAAIMVDTFNTLDPVLRSPLATLQPRTSLKKAIDEFCIVLVRVRNYCHHELDNEQSKKRALKSEPITGESVRGFYYNLVPLGARMRGSS